MKRKKKRKIVFSPEAKDDIVDLRRYIKDTLKMSQTASDYLKDLDAAIQKLPDYAEAIGGNDYVRARFGHNARHIRFKKMTIIYLIEEDYLFIRRVIPSSAIY
jgi:plasmid stabilization system protein ParE